MLPKCVCVAHSFRRRKTLFCKFWLVRYHFPLLLHSRQQNPPTKLNDLQFWLSVSLYDPQRAVSRNLHLPYVPPWHHAW